MQTIMAANENVLAILKKFMHSSIAHVRLSKYVVKQDIDEGILLFNLLTRELLLLTQDENNDLSGLDYLRKRWFLVPDDANEKEYAGMVKWVLSNRQRKAKHITHYVIFPTTDCNARCFYCFELGRSRIPMSHETALKVVDYIKKHCGDKQVKISWFGGEPLYNLEAIDTICDGLRQAGVEFKSVMTSNGYLFDDESVRKAVEKWNLKRVQITLDGTEKVYNKTKAYIYKEGSPYQKVLANIGSLLDASIAVQIRMNMDLYNAEDLYDLVGELGTRFAGKKGFTVYSHHLFKGNEPMAITHTEEEWEKRGEAMQRIEEAVLQNGLRTKRGLSKIVRLNHCMADGGNAVTILPNGHIGLCEHFSEDEFIGHIDHEGFDQIMVESWKERMPEIPECDDCFYYPECIKLKKCANGSLCFKQLRQDQLRKTKQQMLYEYENWKMKTNPTDLGETDFC